MKAALYPLANMPPAKKAELVKPSKYFPWLIAYGDRGQVAIVGAIDHDNGVILQSVADDDEEWLYAFNVVGHLLRFAVSEIKSITDMTALLA